ncbi:hypothetical protein [Bacillus sp. FJAT-27245]|uniref:hypothetical protein n=1 Tax=Bacillus sp. FJAT-27245 TaxID=1684144 RepID=UPI0006A7AE56|nr:hypothetical protein [Bacillus sp. FJAT-27245]
MRKRAYQGSFLNKKWFVVLLAILLALLLFFIASGNAANKEKTLSDAAGAKLDSTTKIVFRDGRGMNQPFSLEDAGKISEFIGKLDGYVVKKEVNPEARVGWIHAADFYEGKKKFLSITFIDPLIINGTYYEIIKGKLQRDEIEQFIQSANPDWKKK